MAAGRRRLTLRTGVVRRGNNAPAAAEQLFQTALKLHEEGALQRAEHVYREVLRQYPRHAGALNMLGVIGCQTGNFKLGAQLIRQALALEPDDADFNNNLGQALMDSGDVDAARPAFERALKARQRFPEAHFNLANALLASGCDGTAEKHYRKAIRQRPDYADAMNNLGNLLRKNDQAVEAAQLLRKVVKFVPDSPACHFNLALALQAQAQFEKAIRAFRRSLELDDESPDVWEALGHCYRQRGSLSDAEEAFKQALARHDRAPALLNALGLVQFAQNRVDDALKNFDAALAIDDKAPMSLNHAGMAYSALGDEAAARRYFERALELAPGFGDAYRHLAELTGGDAATGTLIETIERQLASGDLPDQDRIDMHFACGKLYDDRGEFERAFEQFTAANNAKRAGVQFDAAAQSRFIDAIIEVFDAQFFTGARATVDMSEAPLFILGMPRSGTSLVEQIIASHRTVFGAGELTFFPEHVPALGIRLASDKRFPYCVAGHWPEIAELAPMYLALLRQRGRDAARVTDKMPYNFLYLGIIRALFPRARVVHCRRDAMATCFSIYIRNLAGNHPYSYDLEDLGAAYRGYARLMAHWSAVLPEPVIDVEYEALVGDAEGQTRRLIDALGLEWDPACLAFHRTDRLVTTASQWQVRQPIYTQARDHWRNYAAYLEPLHAALSGPQRD